MPDLFYINLYLKRIARGRFVLDGTINVGVDLTDETIIYTEVFYSPTAQNFVRTPITIPSVPLSQYMNTFFKDIGLETLNDCATNPPLRNASETFVSPLTKRIMILENCTFENDNAPSHLRPGFYKINYELRNQVESKIIALAKMEPK